MMFHFLLRGADRWGKHLLDPVYPFPFKLLFSRLRRFRGSVETGLPMPSRFIRENDFENAFH
jgi:hypothetical protein